jgi:DNA primase
MDAISLKQYILENNKIEEIIKSLNCHGFKEYTKEYRSGLPDHTSTDNIAINKETLSTKIFQSDSEIIRGDIFTLCQTIKNISFPQANKYLHKLLGLEYKFKTKENKPEKKDPLNIFKKVKRKKCITNIDNIEMYDEEIIKEYIPLPHITWINEGILPFTCDVFKIGYSAEKKRIVIPTRYWCGEENDFIGIMGRTTILEWEMLDIPKYFPLKKYFKSLNIYGLQENYKTIQEAGFCCVAESQKSVLKRHSRKDGTVVAIESHDISPEQVKILIGINVDIIIAFDQGVSLQHIRHTCENFYGIRNISYIHNKYDLLKDKQAPMDLPDKLYKYMLKYKTAYDESEHKKYIKERDKQFEKRIQRN